MQGEHERENRRQQIIDGALEIFASQGFEAATNKDIARAAGIGSPGLIYHYFKDKADLFRQVVEQRAPVLHFLARDEELMELPPREVLTLLAASFSHTMDNRTAIILFKLMLGESIRRPMVAEMVSRIGPGRGLRFLTRYLQLQMDRGVLRRMDPGAAARCLLGPLVAYIMTREVFLQDDSQRLDARTMADTAVDIFLRGMQPEESPRES